MNPGYPWRSWPVRSSGHASGVNGEPLIKYRLNYALGELRGCYFDIDS
jgi:hypothetical protein